MVRKTCAIGLMFLVTLLASTDASGEDTVKQITQYGITWTFERPARAGQFINGDWWVVGPVTVVSVSPAPGPAPADDVTSVTKNQFGDAALQNDNRMRNGSMVILRGGNPGQGYDSRVKNFDPKLPIALPYTLAVNHSLVSTASHPASDLPVTTPFFRGSGRSSWAVLRTAAVLTCLPATPPADAFRPCYVGDAKVIYRAGDLRREKLLTLKPLAGTPSYDEWARKFQRVWLDDQRGWLASRTYPSENCPDYGREHARMISIASLMLMLDAPPEEKEKLLIGLVQVGIDLSGIAKLGGTWPGEGGIWSGRKWPILFAGILLDDPKLYDLPATAIFAEDQQTYYGRSFFGQTALWQMGVHHGKAPPYEEKDPATWTAMDKRSEGYRTCCTGNAWIGVCLAARLLGAVQIWNHDAFFDYCDRWMSAEDAEIAKQRPSTNSFQGRSWDPFVTDLWKAYRATCPEQAGASRNRKWVWDDGGKWVPNPKPETE